ncbi:MAG: AAA family ATPase [Planctomycetes bacterium]|nr:AAA family ATPase [Planctomycetota bacterium]
MRDGKGVCGFQTATVRFGGSNGGASAFADGIRFQVPRPAWDPERDDRPRLVGQEELVVAGVAASETLDDVVPRFSLVGPAGRGKSTLALAVAAALGRPAYVVHCNGEMEVGDLTISGVVSGDRIGYVASPLVAALLRPEAVVVLENFGEMPVLVQSKLLSLLDEHRVLTSEMLGVSLRAGRGLVVVFTMLECSARLLDEQVAQRTRPWFRMGPTPHDQMMRIVEERFAESRGVLEAFRVEYEKNPLSPREAVGAMRLGIQLWKAAGRPMDEAAVARIIRRAFAGMVGKGD